MKVGVTVFTEICSASCFMEIKMLFKVKEIQRDLTEKMLFQEIYAL